MTAVDLQGGENVNNFPKVVEAGAFWAQVLSELAGNANVSSYSKRFTLNENQWRDNYHAYVAANPTNNTLYLLTDNTASLSDKYAGVRQWIEDGATVIQERLVHLALGAAGITAHDIDGGLDASSLAVVQNMLQGKSNATVPVISPWLSLATGADPTQGDAERIDTLSKIFPSMTAKKSPSSNSNVGLTFGSGFKPLSIMSKVSRSDIEQMIREIVTEDGITVKEAVAKAFDSTSYAVTIGSVDPVGVCMPTSSHPYVHWHHPHMKAITAPGSFEGMNVDLGANAQNTDLVNNIRYTPYTEWGRDSLIMTGIVPFGAQAERMRISMGYGAVQSYNSSDSALHYEVQAGLQENNVSGGNQNDDSHDNILAYIDGVDGWNVIALASALYDGLFNFTGADSFGGAAGNPTGQYENPFSSNWEINTVDGNGTVFNNKYTDFITYPSMIPYFSYSSGFLGLGSIRTANNTPTDSGRPTYDGVYVDDSIKTNQEKHLFDMWANWFPYLPSVNHQNVDRIKQSASENYGDSLKHRISEVLFGQRTGPVYLPASRSVYKKASDWTGATAEQDLSNPMVLVDDGDQLHNRKVPKGEYVHEQNVGYHPMLSGFKNDLDHKADGSLGSSLRTTLTYPASDRNSQIIDALAVMSHSQVATSLLDNADFYPDSEELSTKPFDGAVLRSALSTETMGWINLYTKTYNRVYGHDSIHPYAFMDVTTEKPIWHKDFQHSKDATSGKGPDKDVDTLYAGDIGTGLYVSKRSVFMDPLCLGVGAVRSTGQLMHDSASDETSSRVFRDIFDLCSYEREIALLLNSNNANTTGFNAIVRTSAAWSKMGMQSKLLFNSSLRVLHTRPGGALSTASTNPKASAGKEANYGSNSSVPTSLTEMFLCVDPTTNKLHTAPRATITSSRHKPFIHLESLIHDDQGVQTHPNYNVMKRLNPLVSSNMGGRVDGDKIVVLDNTITDTEIDQLSFERNDLVSANQTTSQRVSSSLAGSKDLSVLRDKGTRADTDFHHDLSVDMGDVFAVDPFDLLWEASTTKAAKDLYDNLPATANTANNSGVEYELLSSLARVHAQASTIGLTGALNAQQNAGLIDTVPTPNELTMPGDHEIVFVLYTGDYGNQMVTDDIPQGVNPPVAGCHIKATIEVNRPSERYDSETYGESTIADAGIHYGVTTPYAMTLGSNNSDGAGGTNTPTGLHTYTVAGGRPTLDLAVWNNDGVKIADNVT